MHPGPSPLPTQTRAGSIRALHLARTVGGLVSTLVGGLVGTLAGEASAQSPVANAQAYEAPVQNQRLRSGVPLGGIGCGKLEYLTDGAFGAFTGNGNWDRPVDLLPLSFLAVATTGTDGLRVVRALASGDPAGVPSVETSWFDGTFPRATARFDDPALPFTVVVRATASFDAGDLFASSVPGALFQIELVAPPGASLPDAEVFLAFENLAGVGGRTDLDYTDRTGSRATPFSAGDARGIRFETTRVDVGIARNAIGTLAIAARTGTSNGADRSEVRAIGTFNGAGDGRDLARALLGEQESDGHLGGFDAVGQEGALHPGGLLQVTLQATPGGRANAGFAIAWHAPHLFTEHDESDHGKPYLDRFEDAAAVATWLLQNADDVQRIAGGLERTLSDSTLPAWLVRKLMNGLCPLVSNSVLTRDLIFGALESPVTMRGALGTMDQRLSSHAAYSFLFPFLDMRELESFAILQLPRGQITHFSGNVHLRLRSANVPYGISGWPDLSSSFVLQVDALARWTGNDGFLRSMRSHVDRALDWIDSQDHDGDGIPEGGTTFDNRVYEGSLSYTASVYLAALSAGARIAERFDDRERAALLRARATRTQDTLIGSMWNGRWFEKAHDPTNGHGARDCFMAQLAGEFRAALQSLPPTVPPALSMRASMSLLEQNAAPGRPMPVIDLAPGGGESWTADTWVQYTETYLLQQLMQQGFAGQALLRLQAIAEAERFLDLSPWNVALVYDSLTGQRKWGDQYMTTTAAWFLPRVLTGMDIDRLDEATSGATLTIDPRVPASWESFRIPVHSPDLVLRIAYDAAGPDRHRRIELCTLPGSGPTSIGRLILGLPPGTPAERARLIREDGKTIVSGVADTARAGRAVFLLNPPMTLDVGVPRELFLIDPTSGVLDLTGRQPRSLGAAVEILTDDEKGQSAAGRAAGRDVAADTALVRLQSRHDMPWPQVVRLSAAPGRALAEPWLRTPASPSSDPAVDDRVLILPAAALSTRQRSWLRSVDGLPAADGAGALAGRADARGDLAIYRDGRVRAAPAADSAALRDRYQQLVTGVARARAAALDARDIEAASRHVPVAFTGSFVGNTISDRTLRVRATVDVPTHRWRLDALTATPPEGVQIESAPSVPGGRVFHGPLEVSWILSMDDAARWRRSAFEVEIRGALVDERPVPFRRDVSVSIGFEFVKEFLVLGPFPLKADADRLDMQLGPEPGSMTALRFTPRQPPWRRLDTVFEGVLSLRELAPPELTDAAFFVCIDIVSPSARDARFYLGTGAACRVWLNNEVVHEARELRYAAPGQDTIDITLREGTNRALFKIAGPKDRLALLLEVTDRGGSTMPDVGYQLPGD